ncbi:hypothetical protein [Methanomassiliicoccus luminyensis]|jgi:hypothetical protein
MTFNLIARCIRLADADPAAFPCREGGDVPAGVQICVQCGFTLDASELPSCSVVSGYVTALVSCLGGVLRIDDLYSFSQSLRLVLNEEEEFMI